MATKIDRTVVDQLLMKLGVGSETLIKISDERAMKKLRDRIAAGKGKDVDMTPGETALVESLNAPVVAEELTAYRLAGIDGKPDRIEVMLPAKALARNSSREKTRQWVAAPGETPTHVDGKPVASEEKPVSKTKEKTAAPAAKAKAKDEPKEKAEPKAKAEPKPKKEGDSNRGKATDVFRECFRTKQPVEKADVITQVVAAGSASAASAAAYVVWAKRDSGENKNPAKGGNPFGFVIEEYKTKEGVKTLRKVK